MESNWLYFLNSVVANQPLICTPYKNKKQKPNIPKRKTTQVLNKKNFTKMFKSFILTDWYKLEKRFQKKRKNKQTNKQINKWTNKQITTYVVGVLLWNHRIITKSSSGFKLTKRLVDIGGQQLAYDTKSLWRLKPSSTVATKTGNLNTVSITYTRSLVSYFVLQQLL